MDLANKSMGQREIKGKASRNMNSVFYQDANSKRY